MEKRVDLSEFLNSLERKELNSEQQLLLLVGSVGITVSGNNVLADCSTINCKGGNCGNCVSGCGGK